MSRKIIEAKAPLLEQDIIKINKIVRENPKDYIIIRYKNTKGLDVQELNKLDRKVQIAIEGGFDKNKIKYRATHYMERTFYSVDELIKIIITIEAIERKISTSWSELQKAMFIYKYLTENMHYTSVDNEVMAIDGTKRDCLRTYRNILNGESTCAGFALLYKEFMDRQGIKCDYVNKKGCHDWNVLSIEGKYIPVDLSDECSFHHKKHNNECEYYSFGNPDFYKKTSPIQIYGHHQVIDEEEIDHSKSDNIKYFTREEIQQQRKIISEKPGEREKKEVTFNNKKYDAYIVDINTNRVRLFLENNNERFAITIDRNEFNNIILTSEISKYIELIIPNEYTRTDGTYFYIIPNIIGNNNYIYITYKDSKLKSANLRSETNLYLTNDYEEKYGIANYLLSTQRVTRKINLYNGYVGYYKKGQMIYDRNYERNQLNIFNRQ